MQHGFYVTARLESRTSYLIGPFATKRAALRMVDAGKALALRHPDPRYSFAAYGVTKLSAHKLPPGRLDLTNLAVAYFGEFGNLRWSDN